MVTHLEFRGFPPASPITHVIFTFPRNCSATVLIMKTLNCTLPVAFLLIISAWVPAAQAEYEGKDQALTYSYKAVQSLDAPRYNLDEDRFTRKRYARDLRIRGWEIKDGVYLGQTKVSDQWGLGLVYESGDTFYGVNHRGIQVLKKF